MTSTWKRVMMHPTTWKVKVKKNNPLEEEQDNFDTQETGNLVGKSKQSKKIRPFGRACKKKSLISGAF